MMMIITTTIAVAVTVIVITTESSCFSAERALGAHAWETRTHSRYW